jgi:hypothetical protein
MGVMHGAAYLILMEKVIPQLTQDQPVALLAEHQFQHLAC